MQNRFQRTIKFIQGNKFNTKLLQSFDWPVLVLVLAISVFGVVSIFAANAVPVDQPATSFLELINTQPTYYARLQIFWVMAGLFVLAAMLYFDYELYANWSNTIYWANIAMLAILFLMQRGGDGFARWIRWGSDMSRTAQPSEIGKVAIIIALAKLFASRTKPITRIAELIPMLAYVGLPLILVLLQPDLGTALVYAAIFAVMLFASGTSNKLMIGMVCVVVLMMVPLWYWMTMSESNFRMDRILVFLDQNADLQGSGMQTYNARLAVGSGGFWGKGLFSEGSIAALDYIPEDYTDFIFAIVGETFGFVGAAALVLAYLVLLVRMTAMASQAADAFGTYAIIGVMAMLFFHIFENISMVIGLMPVTGIPLPFVSYGGSNFLTNMAGMGLVLNISMRSREKRGRIEPRPAARL